MFSTKELWILFEVASGMRFLRFLTQQNVPTLSAQHARAEGQAP